MTEQTTTEAEAGQEAGQGQRSGFGEVLAEIMAAKGRETTDDAIRALAVDAGVDVEGLVDLARNEDAQRKGSIGRGLAEALDISPHDKTRLGMAYTFGRKGRELDARMLCRVGSSTKSPCRRPATGPRFYYEPEGPQVCDEHRQAGELHDQATELSAALYALQEWLGSGGLDNEALIVATLEQRDALEREYLEAVIKARAAEKVADAGRTLPGSRVAEPHMGLEDAEAMERLFLRSKAIEDARTILEDLPDSAFDPLDRFKICGALQEAQDMAGAVFRGERKRLGLGRPARESGEASEAKGAS